MLCLIAAGTERAFGRFVLADLHHDSARRLQCGLAPDHRDFVLAHQEADAVVEPLCHDARALDDRRGIVGDLLGGYPVVLGMLQITVDLGRAQQRLGRNAAPVEADAAEIIALHDRGLEAELG